MTLGFLLHQLRSGKTRKIYEAGNKTSQEMDRPHISQITQNYVCLNIGHFSMLILNVRIGSLKTCLSNCMTKISTKRVYLFTHKKCFSCNNKVLFRNICYSVVTCKVTLLNLFNSINLQVYSLLVIYKSRDYSIYLHSISTVCPLCLNLTKLLLVQWKGGI